MTSLARQFSRHDSYTPDALGVDLGRQLILDTVRPVSGGEHVALHNALGRVLAETSRRRHHPRHRRHRPRRPAL